MTTLPPHLTESDSCWQWGVFDYREETGFIHVAPAAFGILIKPHCLNNSCICHPRKDEVCRWLLIHNHIQ